ncbi:hypothetical protein [Treponema pedis]|uniref:hypothetical protein n=1 Tax=Treponema pedis TaxID=409322 RepID=UPI0003F7DF51|nr:hypothetical protein [Treponema pedis]
MKKFIIGFIVFSVLFAGCNQGKQNPTKSGGSGTNPGSTSAPPPTSNEQNGPLVLNLNWAAEAEITLTGGKHNFKFTISDQNTVFTVFDKNNPKDLGKVFGMEWATETKKISSPDSKDAEFEITFTDTPLPVSAKEPKTWKATLDVKKETKIHEGFQLNVGKQEVIFTVTYNKYFVKQ